MMSSSVFELLVLAAIAACIDVPYFVQENTTFFLEDPQSQVATKQSSVTFHCRASIQPTMFAPYPQLDIIWLKNNVTLRNDSRIIIEKGVGYSRLQILKVGLNDTGMYQCMVRDGPAYNSNNGNDPCVAASSFSNITQWMFKTFSQSANLNIIGELEDATAFQNVSVLVKYNQPLLLNCSYVQMMENPDYVEWSFNGASLNDTVSKMWILVSGRNLLIQSLTEASVGNYSCIATWFVNHTVAVITYSVSMEKDSYNGTPIVIIDRPNIAINGSKYVLNCYTAPDPNIAVVWIKNKTIVSHMHSLEFDMISNNDCGLYTCAIDQNNISLSQSVDVQVLVPPVFLTERFQTVALTEQRTQAPHPTLIQCQVTGTPVPSITLYKNGQALSVLSINAIYSDYGVYQCFANNSAGASYGIIRAITKGTVSAPSNMLCFTTVTANSVYKVSTSWMTPTYFGSISTITYSIGYCLGTTLSNKDNRTNNSYYQLQLDSIADKTIYVSTCYVSFDGSSQQSAPTFCHAPQPSQSQWLVDCHHNIATFNATGDAILSRFPFNLWKYCFNENQTLDELTWTSALDDIENTTYSSQDSGFDEICAFGGNISILDIDIPVKVCGPTSDNDTDVSNLDNVQIHLNCSDVSQASLTWRTTCSSPPNITIYGTCRNFTHQQKVMMNYNANLSGEVSVKFPSTDSTCAFRVHYKYGSVSTASTLLYCYFDKKADFYVFRNLNCFPHPSTDNLMQGLEIMLPMIVLFSVVIILAVGLLVCRLKSSSDRLNVISKHASNSWDIDISDIKTKPTDCTSITTDIDNLCFATESPSDETTSSSNEKETWQEVFGSSSYDSSDPYHLPSCDTSVSSSHVQR